MIGRTLGAVGAALVIAISGGTGVASASDASLVKVVKAQEAKSKPAVSAFQDAAQKLESKKDLAQVKTATSKLITRIAGYRKAVAGEQASSAKTRAARKQLLAGLAQLKSGLSSFKTAFAKIQDGASKETILSSLGAALDKIEAADKKTAKAAKAFGIEDSDEDPTSTTDS